MRWQDPATQCVTGDLHSVANAQNWNVQIENLWINLRSAVAVNAGRAAGKNQPPGIQGLDAVSGQIMSNQLAEHVLIANTASDKLSRLATKVHDEN